MQDAIMEITAFQKVLQKYLQENSIIRKIPVHQAVESTRELMSIVSVLINYFQRFTDKYNVNLVKYATLHKIEKLYEEVGYFHKLLGTQQDLDSDTLPPHQIEASAVADYVCHNSRKKQSPKLSRVKCQICKENCRPSAHRDRKNQFTCATVDVKRRYCQKRQKHKY